MEDAVKDLSNVSAESYDGMLFDYLGAHPDAVLVKGIRSEKDYLYEQEMAQANHELCRRKYGFEAETLFLPCSPCYANVSSTLVRILAANGGDYSDLVPNPVLLRDYLASSLSNN